MKLSHSLLVVPDAYQINEQRPNYYMHFLVSYLSQ